MKFKKPAELQSPISTPVPHHKKSFSVPHIDTAAPPFAAPTQQKSKHRFPFEIFSAGSSTRAKRKLANVGSLPELFPVKRPLVAQLKSSVDFEDMVRLKNECREIICGGLQNESKLQTKLPLISRKGSVVLSSPLPLPPPAPLSSFINNGKLSGHSISSKPIKILHRFPLYAALFGPNPVQKSAAVVDPLRQTAFFKSSAATDCSTNTGTNSQRIIALSAPAKKSLAVRIKQERQCFAKNVKVVRYQMQPRSVKKRPPHKKSEDSENEEFTFGEIENGMAPTVVL